MRWNANLLHNPTTTQKVPQQKLPLKIPIIIK